MSESAQPLERQAELIHELSERIGLARLSGWQCNCGCFKFGEATVQGIRPSTEFPRDGLMWTVDMGGYVIGLDTFMSVMEVDALFHKYGGCYHTGYCRWQQLDQPQERG
jgi:hypothetical protein